MAIFDTLRNLASKGVAAIGQYAPGIFTQGRAGPLPEYGISEALASEVPKQTFPQGPQSTDPGAGLGVGEAERLGATQPQQQTSGGGGGGSSGGRSGSITSDEALKRGLDINYLRSQGLLIEEPSRPSIDFNALIAPALEEFDRSIGEFQGGFSETQKGIQTSKGTQLGKIQSGVQEAETTAGRRIGETRVEGEGAVGEERSRLNEVLQGLAARFGRTTGTGLFSGELSTRQTLKNIGDIRQTVSQNIQKLQDTLGAVKEASRIAELEAEDNARDQVNKARENLNANLAQIRAQKGQLQAQKAQLAFQAMQFYQQQVQQVKIANAQFLQSLEVQRREAEAAVNQKIAGARESIQKLRLENIGTSDNPNFVTFNPATGATAPIAGGSLLDKEKQGGALSAELDDELKNLGF